MTAIKKIIPALLLLAVMGCAHKTARTKKSAVTSAEFGLQLYSLRNQFAKDIPGTLAKIKNWGIKEVEVAGTYSLSATAFRTLLDEYGLTAVSMGASFEQLDTNAQAVADEAKILGVKYVMCAWIPHNADDIFRLEDANKAIAVFNRAGKILQQNGLSFCYHAHGYEFRPYGNSSLFDYLVQQLDPQYVNFEMDVYWMKHPGEDAVALLKKYPTRFSLMHLKDRKPGTPGNLNGRSDVETNVVLGQGDVGIAAAVKEARRVGVKHFFIEDESSRSETQIPLSLAFLKSL
jgi:sugar phosphate isomerase/epimerase